MYSSGIATEKQKTLVPSLITIHLHVNTAISDSNSSNIHLNQIKIRESDEHFLTQLHSWALKERTSLFGILCSNTLVLKGFTRTKE
jgi:hypothetical protein